MPAVVMIEARATVAAAPSSRNDQATAQAASYSTGAAGSRLKWLPQSSSSSAESRDSRVTPVQYTVPSSTPHSRRVSQRRQPSSGTLNDALGDAKKTPTPAPAEKIEADALPAMPLEPKEEHSEPNIAPSDAAGREKNDLPPLRSLTPGKTAPRKPNATESMLEEYYSSRQNALQETCPSPKDLKHIADLSTNITPSEGELPKECPLGNDIFKPRHFAPITYTWTASGLCHKPLYFEDVQLERYGHMAGPWLQPFASGAHFFLTVPILPYKMGLELPNECMYTLGYYRPGSCAPYLFDPIPLSLRGALFEAGAWVGGVFCFP